MELVGRRITQLQKFLHYIGERAKISKNRKKVFSKVLRKIHRPVTTIPQLQKF